GEGAPGAGPAGTRPGSKHRTYQATASKTPAKAGHQAAARSPSGRPAKARPLSASQAKSKPQRRRAGVYRQRQAQTASTTTRTGPGRGGAACRTPRGPPPSPCPRSGSHSVTAESDTLAATPLMLAGQPAVRASTSALNQSATLRNRPERSWPYV